MCDCYRDCRSCKHGLELCRTCPDCIREARLRKQQEEHDRSVRRQKNRIRIAEWRQESI